jgi:hypothetical protein
VELDAGKPRLFLWARHSDILAALVFDLLPDAADLDLEVVMRPSIRSLPLSCAINLKTKLLLEGILDLSAHGRARSVERVDDGSNVLRLVRGSGVKSARCHLALMYVLNYMAYRVSILLQ